MPDRVVARRRITVVRDGARRAVVDDLAGEEPLEVRVDGQAVAVTMRTPGDDFDLALGFCLSEGVLTAASEVETVRYCPDPGVEQQYNVVDVRRRIAAPLDESLRRNVYMTSSCGVCGTASIDLVRKRTSGVGDDDVVVAAGVVSALPERLRAAQRVFDRTGGLHAAGLFTAAGDPVAVREDVGRHNAVDKLIGWAAREQRLPLTGLILMVSGRVAFEIVQKALIAGIPIIAAVSAPTSLAVSLADDAGLTLIGFVRDAGMNIYTGEHRVEIP